MAPPTLDTLPSELRKLIVSFLAPIDFERFGKVPLKQANLAHSCLREWVPEYLFRDMSLIHVSPDNASHLELFAISPDNSKLLKYVKNIEVKMPPAIRWDIDTQDPFDTIEDITQQRLTKKFRVKSPKQLNDEQQRYCTSYHRAMVHPFAENRRWYNLLHVARDSWREVFSYFPNLDRISVGTIERIHHPYPTYTNAFVTKYGNKVDLEVEPAFLEDWTVNLAWASSTILECVPTTVKSLRLSMANLDNLNSFATVNRLLSFGYYKTRYLMDQPLNAVTKVILDIRGPKGTHGERNWPGDTGSAGGVKYWQKVLISMPSLTHLDIRFDLCSQEVAFTDLEESDPTGCVLDWLLSGISLVHLHTLCLRYFRVDRDAFAEIFAGQDKWPNLKTLILDELRLMMTGEPKFEALRQDYVDHLYGKGWLHACQNISASLPGVEIDLIRPSSNINDQSDNAIRPIYAEELSQIPAVVNVCLLGLPQAEPLPPIENSFMQKVTSEASTADELPRTIDNLTIIDV